MKVTKRENPPRMFSLACNLTKNDVDFLPIEISLKKVRATTSIFRPSKIHQKKESGNNMNLSIIDITRKRVRENNVDFSISKITTSFYQH